MMSSEDRGACSCYFRSESDRCNVNARAGQAWPLHHPAVRSRVVDLHRAKISRAAVVDPAEDVELTTHRCRGVTIPSDAHAGQLSPSVGLWVIHAGRVQCVSLVFATIARATSHVDLATHRCDGVPCPALRHACHPQPAVGLRVVDFHRFEYGITVGTIAKATHAVDLAVKHHRGMANSLHAHARHQSPRAELRIVGLD
eukprot:scaffold80276_cov62-Phaeocystis_antarctica.AAC.2